MTRPSRGAWARFAALVALGIAAFILLRRSGIQERLEVNELIELLNRLGESPFAPFGHVLLFLLLCPLGAPVSPLIFAGGAVFGTWLGALLNFVGTLAGGMLTFVIARHLGSGLVEQLLGRYRKLLRRLVRQHGFWSLMRLRFLPVPYTVANLAAALAGVKPTVFLSATAVAFVPAMVVYSYIGATLVDAASDLSTAVGRVLLAMMGFLALTFVPTCILRLQRSRRYRSLSQARRDRNDGIRATAAKPTDDRLATSQPP